MFIVLALLLGVISGMRTMTWPGAVSWVARTGALAVAATPMAFMGFSYAPTRLAMGPVFGRSIALYT